MIKIIIKKIVCLVCKEFSFKKDNPFIEGTINFKKYNIERHNESKEH